MSRRSHINLAVAALAAFSGTLHAEDPVVPRKAAELAFNLPGEGQKLLSQYRGKVVAIEFIFTTCPHCQAASKVMSRFQNEYGPRGFQAIDIAVNQNADLLVANFQKDYQVAFPVGFVPQEQMMSFMGYTSTYFVVPQLALIDRKGVIHYQTPARENDQWDLLMKEDTLRQHIEELLGASTAGKRTGTGAPGAKVASMHKTS